MSRAIEAAAKTAKVALQARPMIDAGQDHINTIHAEKIAFAAIRAYLAALAEDDAAVEKVARAIWDDKEPNTRVWEDKHEIMKDEWRRTARAAIRALGE